MILFLSRYELPGVSGLNFVLRKSLGGGGVSSLRPDPQVCWLPWQLLILQYRVKDTPKDWQ